MNNAWPSLRDRAVRDGTVGHPWRRVVTHYDKYAYRCLGFLYLAGAWIWMN